MSFFALWAGASMAVEHTPLTPQQKEIVQEVQHYFNTLGTYQAQFRQVDLPQNVVQEGDFYLQRPKKFLWQYRSPQPQKLVSTGSRLFYVDETSEQVTQLPLSFGLAAVLTKPKLNFMKGDFKLLTATDNPKEISLTVALNGDDPLLQPATVEIYLHKNPLRLAQLHTRTPLGQETRVVFSGIKQGQPMADHLFNYIPPQEEITLD